MLYWYFIRFILTILLLNSSYTKYIFVNMFSIQSNSKMTWSIKLLKFNLKILKHFHRFPFYLNNFLSLLMKINVYYLEIIIHNSKSILSFLKDLTSNLYTKTSTNYSLFWLIERMNWYFERNDKIIVKLNEWKRKKRRRKKNDCRKTCRLTGFE